MKVTVTTLSDEVYNLNVHENLELENFKAFCEVESGYPASEIVIVYNGRPLSDDKMTLKQYGIKNNDVVCMQHILAPSRNSRRGSTQSFKGLPSFSGIQIPTAVQEATTCRSDLEDDPAVIREIFLANPSQLALLEQNNPSLAEALLSNDLNLFASMLNQQRKAHKERERLRLRLMHSKPYDLNSQKLIAEEIRQRNIDANLEAAMEHTPETFASVIMLYINCKVNGIPVKAFVDSGAQTTIMSAACAKNCNLMRLVDTRWEGTAQGVGVQRIIGRIHLVQLQIEDSFLLTSFCVLEKQPMDMLLGLDMLKRHECCIDLKHNVLLIGTTNTVTRFLDESELPACARNN